MFNNQRLNKETFNIVEYRLEKMKEIFPEVFTEGKIDFDKLREVLGDLIDDRPERYLFSWAGRTEAIRLLQRPIFATLIPCPEESIDFENANHIFIEGENLEVLQLLLKPYFGRVKMIYIDPPYNTGEDFIYKDDYKEPLKAYLKQTGQMDENGNHLTSNQETNGRYHSAWITNMYPRLFLARQLLRDDGVICISIGEEELYNLRLIMNQIFGEENYRNMIIVRRYDKNLNTQFINQGLKTLNVGTEFVLIYARSSEFTFNPVYREASEDRQAKGYWKGFWNAANRPTMRYELLGVKPDVGQWKWKEEVAIEAVKNYEEYLSLYAEKMSLEEYWEATGKSKKFIRRNPEGKGKNQGVEHWVPPSTGILRSSNWTDILASQTLTSIGLSFDNPKNVNLIKELIKLCSDEGDIILDFFAGSCTTAHAILELNFEDEGDRQFIMVQLPQVTPKESEARRDGYKTIAEIGKERIRRVIRGYGENPQPMEGVGFKVFKLAPSNFKQWEDYTGDDPDKYIEQLSLYQNALVEGYRDIDVIYEVILKEGYDLNSRIEKVESVTGNTVYRITDPIRNQSFYICLDEKINLETLEPLALKEDDLFICLDTALNDTIKANLALQCRLKTI